ncbi:riboflavin synthase domain-like protein [Corynespora cassiicola Philippines]|uniref:Riboflavin synthase domain-like protein n=1 Tax=Corynespora cassiicola Philippines TaxID=1448308 RepID=A0A2T2NHK8_CORCC|nr:riboflavin synthase domain-like protein [Corynespora cassiicola Philippines]
MMISLELPKTVPAPLLSSLEIICSGKLHRLPYDDLVLFPFILVGVVYYLGQGTFWAKPDPYRHIWFERPQLKKGNGFTNESPGTRNIAGILESTNSELAIFWGSQSGTAEGFAHRLAREFRLRYHKNALVMDLSDYDAETIAQVPRNRKVIFLLATYGEGEPCDNTWDTVHWLRSADRLQTSLKDVRFAAFGLGNNKYRFYNKVVVDVVELLIGLGATEMIPYGTGDEASRSTEEDFVEWKDVLFHQLSIEMSLVEHPVEYRPTLKVIQHLPNNVPITEAPIAKSSQRKAVKKSGCVVSFPVKHRNELTVNSASQRHCVYVELDLSERPQIKYKTGDHIAIWPVNPEEEISNMIKLLGFVSRQHFAITIQSLNFDETPTAPSPTTVRALFESHLDISGPIKRETVQSLAQFATTEGTKTFLRMISKDRETFSAFVERNHINLPRLLLKTIEHEPSESWATLPLEFIIENIQPIVPRTYSISSSCMVSPKRLGITVAVTPTKLTRNPELSIPGLASTYLASEACQSVHAQIIPSTFRLPMNHKTPIVMVAAGTGIAPFRGFVQERARVASTGRPVGRMLLFFGCQSPEVDFLYKDELEKFASGSLKGLLEIITAFSRVNARKQYVQHKMRECHEKLTKMLLDEEAAYYVCGSAIMAKDVEKVAKELVGTQEGWNETEVEKWRMNRKQNKLWFEDVWG